MSSESFDKASSKLLGSFAAGVDIAKPGAGERRLTREERERALSVGREVDTAAQVSPEVVEQPEKEKRPVGRPKSENTIEDAVAFPCRVSKAYRQAIKVWAAEKGVTLQEIFEEAMKLFEEKHGIDF